MSENEVIRFGVISMYRAPDSQSLIDMPFVFKLFDIDKPSKKQGLENRLIKKGFADKRQTLSYSFKM